jgi:anion-transporting  ArsA/GET3 family ATPase
MTLFISVGTQELLLDLFDEQVVDKSKAIEELSKLSKEEIDAINEILKEPGC